MGNNAGQDFGISLCETIKTDGSGEPMVNHTGTVDLSAGHDWSAGNQAFVLDGQTITLTDDCDDAAEVTAHIIAKINASTLDVNDYYVHDDGTYISIGYAEFTLGAGTALATLGWTAGTYLYNVIFLAASRVEPGIRFDPGVNSFMDGLSYDLNLGERNVGVRISDIKIMPWGTNTSTDMINKLTDFIFAHSQRNSARIYVHVKNIADDTYVYLSYLNQTDTNIPFIQGRFISYDPLFENGVNKVRSISIQESWMTLSLT